VNFLHMNSVVVACASVKSCRFKSYLVLEFFGLYIIHSSEGVSRHAKLGATG
jgi:hypothetical protein